VFFLCLPASHAAGFDFVKGLFVTEVTGYGQYTEHPSPAFSQQEKITAYLEVNGFENKKEGDMYQLDLVLDLLVKDKSGKVGVEQKGVVVSKNIVTDPMKGMYFTVTIDPSLLRPARYILTFVATDNNTGRKASLDLPIQVK
ncbi:MAG TPA: hypothetical protein DIC53_01180, partial [Synergistaceae bacterium]|nr:hypothetical protein [Synergistaceae bacterium]